MIRNKKIKKIFFRLWKLYIYIYIYIYIYNKKRIALKKIFFYLLFIETGYI